MSRTKTSQREREREGEGHINIILSNDYIQIAKINSQVSNAFKTEMRPESPSNRKTSKGMYVDEELIDDDPNRGVG